tara:strand:- start:355 stop:1611 length:1257 start_codon:yes stop_codon:yes gene_type:complete
MNSFQYAQSVQERAQSAYGDKLTEYNQERQIATAHFEAEKKELVDPLSFIGGGMASSAAGSLGKKIAAKSGIKAFEKLGQESISTTMKNAAKEALEKGKSALTGKINGTIQNAISKDGGKDLINKTLKENGYAELSDADFANPSTLGDKILKQSVSKAKAKLPELPDPKDVKPSNTVAVDDLNKIPDIDKTPGDVDTLKDIDLTPSDVDTLKDILTRYVGEDYKSKTELGDSVVRSGAEQAGTGLRGESILARVGAGNLQPTTVNQLGNDDLPDSQRVQQEMSQDENSLGQSLSEQEIRVNGQPKAPQPEDRDAIRPASPKPSGDPVPEPADADAAKAGETGAAEGEEEGANILSKLTDIVGASDVASGGLDIGGDILEAGLGIAGLFLPGLLDTQKKAAPAPVNNFVGNYSAGTGVV